MGLPYRHLSVVALMLGTIVIVPAPAAHAAEQHVVRPGQSIQAALDAASPGDTVLVEPGTYRENLEIVTDRVTLRSRGARLEPPQTPTPRRCSITFGISENPYGICVAGEFDPATGAVLRPVTGVTVEGMTIGEFAQSGIIVAGAHKTSVLHSNVAGGPGDAGYSLLLIRSSLNRVVGNRVHGAGGAGIYIGSSPDARSTIENNVVSDSGSFGIMVRDAVSGKVEGNLTFSNCMGIGFVDGGSPGTTEGWTARNNVVLSNTDVCPGSGGAPDVSGVGILLAGAKDNTVRNNTVVGNVSGSDNVPYAGGMVLASGAIFGGGEVPTGNRVTRNTVLGNQPFDLNVVDPGSDNNLTRNLCRTSSMPELCTR